MSIEMMASSLAMTRMSAVTVSVTLLRPSMLSGPVEVEFVRVPILDHTRFFHNLHGNASED